MPAELSSASLAAVACAVAWVCAVVLVWAWPGTSAVVRLVRLVLFSVAVTAVVDLVLVLVLSPRVGLWVGEVRGGAAGRRGGVEEDSGRVRERGGEGADAGVVLDALDAEAKADADVVVLVAGAGAEG